MANKKVPMGKIFTNSSEVNLSVFHHHCSNGEEFIYTVYKIITDSNGEEFIYTVYKIITDSNGEEFIYTVYKIITDSNGEEFIYTVYKIITDSNGEEFIYTVYKIITSDCLVSIIYLPWFCKHVTRHDITLKSTCDVNLLSKLSIIFKEWRVMNNMDRGGVIVLFVL